MPQLPVQPSIMDKTVLFSDPEKIAKATHAVDEMLASLSFFKTLLNGGPQVSEIYTHLSLLEHGLKDLSDCTGYNGILAKEMENRHAELRAANLKINQLAQELGRGVTPSAVSAAIRRYESLFRAWYESHGFKYASVTINQWGLYAEMTDELANTVKKTVNLADKETYAAAISRPDNRLISRDPEFDIDPDRYHSNLSDTQRNRSALLALYQTELPNARIEKFMSYIDCNKYHLRHEVFVPYADITAWADSVLHAKIDA